MNIQLLTVKEIEQSLRLGHTKVAEIIRTGELQTVKIGRSRRSSPDWIAEFVQRKLDSQASNPPLNALAGIKKPAHLSRDERANNFGTRL